MTNLSKIRQEDLTPKGQQTRELIYQSALTNFENQGYEATTIQQIAQDAGRSVTTLYRYFPNKEALALAHYEQLIATTLHQIDHLPFQTVAERYVTVIKASIERSTPQREAISALFAFSMHHTDSPLSNKLSALRAEMIGHFQQLVRGATDKPRDNIIDSLGTLLATGHILVTLFWLYDRTPKQEATQRLIAFIEEALKMLRPLLLMPIVGKAIIKLARLLADVFMPVDERLPQ